MTTTSGMTTLNRDLVAKADLARKVPGGSLERRAAGCVAVASGTTASRAASREILEAVEPDDVREAALDALEALAKSLD
jgi:hypothetical protein